MHIYTASVGAKKGSTKSWLVLVQQLKLQAPQVFSDLIERPHLEQRFSSGVRVVSIVAGPGYGKTSLAARLFSSWTGPKLWYSVDASDADLAVFSAHMEAGMQAIGMSASLADGSSAIGLPKELGSHFAERLTEAQGHPLLIFDDVHLIEGSRVQATFNELVERGSRLGACFVLCGRSMPVALHSIAAAAQLASIGARDLAFDEAETHLYLERTLHGEVGGALTRLIALAEGWPAGLALIASSARDAARPESDRLSREILLHKDAQQNTRGSDEETRRFLFDYLASEVLDGLRDTERDFLLDTSILDQLETGLCDAVRAASGSGEILESFSRRGLFVARRSDVGYTYHQLFREFLRHTLSRARPPEYVSLLHHRAAKVLAERSDAAKAIGHHLDAGDIQAAVSELEALALTMLRGGLISAVSAILRRIDVERIQSSPTLLVVLGRVQRERGEWDAALLTLERAVSGARAHQAYDVLAEAVRTCAPILASRGEFERLRLMLDEALSPGLALPETSVTSLRLTLAAVCLEMNRLDESLAMYREITPSIIAQGDLSAHGIVLHNTAVAHLRRGDIYAGLSLYERALKLKETTGQRISRLSTLGDLIYVKTLLGDVEEAQRLLETMTAQAMESGATGLIARAHEQRGVLSLLRGDVEGARQAFRSAQEASDPSDTLLLPDIEHGLAKCALATNNLAEADELCARGIAVFRKAGRHQQLATILITRADIAAARGDVNRAVGLATEAATEAAQGTNGLLEASTCLEAAALLVRCAQQLEHPEAMRIDKLAMQAATTAIALMHQRDYRFLLRTRSSVFETLHHHFRRWGIGSGLMLEMKTEPPVAPMQVEMLGTFRVTVNGKEVPPEAWKRRKALDILAYLICQSGRGVTRARLIDLYWPESDADGAHDSLRVTITSIRKAVGDVIKYEANTYRFVAPPDMVIDVDLFDGYLERARQADAQGDRGNARFNYQAGANLYRGDFLDGMHEGGWQWRERERLRATCIEALRWLANDREEAQDAAGQRLVVDRLLEVAPFDLTAVKMRLDALSREMRVSEARRDYQEWRARYKAAVGAEAPDVWRAPEIKPVIDVAVPAQR